MRLKVLLPTEVLLDEEVGKVTAEAQNGFFCLLPAHIDFVTALVPGLLSFESKEGEEIFVAVDEGVLVKEGQNVWVSTRNAMRGTELGRLRKTVEDTFKVLDDREKTARSAMAKIEAGFVRRFLEIQRRG
ncbi:MAG: F0F1 ATP synthase subunit epsilon [Deltaproteobacteria bacterium]|nr:F0F1 ATP synthase subunit epsilon [Deltaproteobacteria bacterium]